MKKIPYSTHNSHWEGYTLDQLMTIRAVTAARIELEQEKVAENFDRARAGNMYFSSSMFSRIFSAINYVDYLVIGVNLWRKLRGLRKS